MTNYTDNICPDGRPWCAVENELQMLRSQVKKAKQDISDAHNLCKLAGIVRVYREDNPQKTEMIIRVQFEDIMHLPLNSSLLDFITSSQPTNETK